MGKKNRRKKHLARLRAVQNKKTTQPAPSDSPNINLLKDNDATAPQTKVASDVKKISLIMVSLAAVVVVIAILNVQTTYVSAAGKQIMQWLHIASG